ncbi:unnamed protein product [Anisakis simplex]|uniref:Nuclear pore complex protein n=1 Tax=Anisakis simplex TaxID=6269 RepID=A0A3P6QS98_ANISI|nr:unnamed protein product [Anisakis simplex]
MLDWCEENAFNEPSANSELTEEYSQLENGAHIRAETLYRRKKGEEWCDMDLDGAMHGRLHPIDEDRQNRVYNLVYTLIRCGKLSEAIKLLDHVGLLALIPSFKFREMARDASLTPLSCDHRLFRLANSRLSFKQTVEKIIHRGLSMSQIERCIWSAVGGLLEPGLSLSQRTDDRLWCYLNTAIENRLDIAIMKHHPDLCDEDSLQQKTSDLMVTSIFDEIATQERSPFYSSYRFLITNDAESHVTFMRQWLETHLHERHNVHFLRYITHLVIVYMSTNQPFAEEDAYWILERYIDVLVSQKMYTIIPYYASKLPSEAAERLTIGFMYEIEDEKMRIDVLASCHEVGVDTTTLCKKVFSYAVDVCQIGEQRTESDAKLISAWNWLKYPGKEAVIDALFAANLILRKFFAVEKVKEAKLVFDQMEENLSETIEKLWSIEYRDASMPKELSDAIAENRAYQAYIEASDDFNNWFKQLKMTQPETPKSPTKEVWSRMNIHQRAAFEVEQAKVRELQQRHRATCDSLRSTAIDSLESLSLWPNGWLKFAPLDETLRNNADLRKKMEELREIRQSYVSAILGMLITIYDQSQDSSGAIRLAMLLADEKNEIAEALSRDQLCSFVRRLSVAHGGINQ